MNLRAALINRWEIVRNSYWFLLSLMAAASVLLSLGTLHLDAIIAGDDLGDACSATFMADTGNQVVLGTFTSTFLFCLLVLRQVRSSDNGFEADRFIPQVNLLVAMALAICSLGVCHRGMPFAVFLERFKRHAKGATDVKNETKSSQRAPSFSVSVFLTNEILAKAQADLSFERVNWFSNSNQEFVMRFRARAFAMCRRFGPG